MQPVFQQNSQRRSVRHAELLAVRARVSSQRPFLTGGGFLVLVISCGRDAAKLFPQFPGTGCFLPLAVSYRRPFPVAGRFLRLAHLTPVQVLVCFSRCKCENSGLHHAPAKNGVSPCMRWDVMSSVDVECNVFGREQWPSS